MYQCGNFCVMENVQFFVIMINLAKIIMTETVEELASFF